MTTEAERNGHTEELTIEQAAGRLGVTIPRLRRLLARPECATFTYQTERQTKTGKRTATVVPVPILPLLREALEHHREPEQQQKRSDSLSLAVVKSAMETALSERERVIAEKDATIARLEAALEHEREQTRVLMQALQQEQTLRAISAASPETPAPADRRPWWRFWWKERG